ncbi:MAG: N-acetylneuraminate synthase [Oligoflexia bacterium]|nr:N-acetylneuraminate synthase [Oligoflexia bacterium]
MKKECFIIADVAQAHDGSLGFAHAFIDAVADTGANCVKFQTHIAAEESTPGEPWRIKFSPQDDTRYEYWQRMEFTDEQWIGLKNHAEEKGLEFMSSPFSFKAFEFLKKIGVKKWKIASGETSNYPLLEKIISTGDEIIVSSGMSKLHELQEVIDLIKKSHNNFSVMQCTSMYPCPPEYVGLNVLDVFKDKFNCPVGLSDHSGTIFPGLAAAAWGAYMIEVHITLSKRMYGPDVSSSLTTEELKQLVEGVRFYDQTLANPVDKDKLADELQSLRDTFQKSVVAKRDIDSGELLSEENLTLKKPGTGIPAAKFNELFGKKAINQIKKDTMLSVEDFK